MDRRPNPLLSALARLSGAGGIPRPGSSIPVGGPLLASPVDAGAEAAGAGRLRRSLRACTAEGMLAEVVGATAGGAVLTGWALHLGYGPALVGALGAVPVVAQAVHLPAAWLTQVVGRRRLAIAANTAGRLCWLALPVLVAVDVGAGARQAGLLAVTALAAVLGVVGNNAWAAWMGDLVPARVRGRYFGGRMALTTLAGTATALAAGVALDAGGGSDAVLSGLAVVAGVAGVACGVSMARQHDPGGETRSARFDWEAVATVVREPAARRLLGYQLAWNGAVGIAGSFFAYHQLANLEMGFALTALHGTAVAIARILAAPAWGRAIDRYGAKPVLVLCSVGIAIVPALWLFPTPDRLWPLAIEAVLAGVLWGGHGLAAFGLPLAVAPARGRPYALGAFATAAGIGFGAASLLGGALAGALPDHVVVAGWRLHDLQVLFAVSAAARLGAGLLALRLVEPRRAGAARGAISPRGARTAALGR